MRLMLSVAFLLIAASARGETTLIAVATNFRPVAEVLAQDFAAASGHQVDLSAAATGKLAAQIEAGAPFDAFLSADSDTVTRLISGGFAKGETRFTYAVGQLVLWSADPQTDFTDPVAALRSARHVAIATPDIAPYGKAAAQSIEYMSLSDIDDNLVTGENIGQTYALVATGAAEMGFVAASATIDGEGVGWVVPKGYHDPIKQDAVLLNNGSQNVAASAFLEYLRSDAAQSVIERFGYAAGS